MNNLEIYSEDSTEVEYWRSLNESLDRLHENEDFKKVILEGYFKDKAINGVSLLAEDNIKRQGLRTDLMESLIAISQLQDYFKTIRNLAEELQAEEEEQEEQLREGA
jgi:hypothetical protein